MIIVFGIDNTLINTRHQATKVLNKLRNLEGSIKKESFPAAYYGVKSNLKESIQENPESIFGTDPSSGWRESNEEMYAGEPIPNFSILSLVERLNAQGHTIHFCTYRAHLPYGRELTEKYLDEHSIQYSNLFVLDYRKQPSKEAFLDAAIGQGKYIYVESEPEIDTVAFEDISLEIGLRTHNRSTCLTHKGRNSDCLIPTLLLRSAFNNRSAAKIKAEYRQVVLLARSLYEYMNVNHYQVMYPDMELVSWLEASPHVRTAYRDTALFCILNPEATVEDLYAYRGDIFPGKKGDEAREEIRIKRDTLEHAFLREKLRGEVQ